MKDVCKVDNQLVLPNMYFQNAAKCVMCMFKSHFLAKFSGIAKFFPKQLWDILLPQTEITLNLLRQSTLKPAIYALEYFNGTSICNHASLGPLGCKITIHKKTGTHHYWEFHGKDGRNIVVFLEHYRCQLVVSRETN